MHGAGAGVRVCGTGRRGQRGEGWDCTEASRDRVARLCPGAAGSAQPLGFGVGGPRVDSPAPVAPAPPRRDAGCAAGGSTLQSRGWKGRGLGGSPSPNPRCTPRDWAGGFQPRTRELEGLELAERGSRPARAPRSCPHQPRESRLERGFIFKRLEGGHEQPPTSLPVRAVDCRLCAGQGAGAVHLAAGTVGPPGWRPGETRGGLSTRSRRPGARPSSRGLEAEGRKAGERCCPAAGSRG